MTSEQASVVEINETTIFNRTLPTPGGMQDARMGTVDRRYLCATCKGDVVTCQGHHGHIELPWPMYHALMFDTVLKTLRSVCFMCSRLALSEDDEGLASLPSELKGKSRLGAVYALAKTKKSCPHCNAPRPAFVAQSMAIRVEWPSDTAWESDDEEEFCTRPFTQRDALSILQNMTDGDCVSLGFDPVTSHPRTWS